MDIKLIDKLFPNNLSIRELFIISLSIKVILSKIEYILLSIEENKVLKIVLIVVIIISVIFS